MKNYGILLDTIIGHDEKSRFIKAVYLIGKVTASTTVLGFVLMDQNIITDDWMTGATSASLVIFMIAGCILGLRYLSLQRNSSLAKSIVKLLIFFLVIPGTLTALIVLLAYIFHAPGINPL